MRKSEIFESFVKIAEEKGLISDPSSEKARKELEKNPRMSALTAKDIEKLYGVKPDAPKGMEYDKNIAQLAHPKPAVVSNSYDKLNGLVENINERQNILLNIVNKPVNGLLTNHKYAEKDLILSLVRLGNSLDNQNKDELRALADTCLVQVSNKNIEKKAALPMLALLGVPALIGAFYLQQHLSFVDEGFETNSNKLISELDDLLNSNSDWGVGYSYSEEFKSTVQDFKNKLSNFSELYQKIKPVISELEVPKTAKELIVLSSKPETTEVIQAYNTLQKSFADMIPYVDSIQKNFASESYKSRQIKDKGLLTSLVDKTQVLHGGHGLVADDFDDVVRAIPPYIKSVKDIMGVLNDAGSLQKKSQQELQQAATESDNLFGHEKSVKDIDNEAGDLGKQIDDLEKDFGPLT
jgi:hypothetical protein